MDLLSCSYGSSLMLHTSYSYQHCIAIEASPLPPFLLYPLPPSLPPSLSIHLSDHSETPREATPPVQSDSNSVEQNGDTQPITGQTEMEVAPLTGCRESEYSCTHVLCTTVTCSTDEQYNKCYCSSVLQVSVRNKKAILNCIIL